MGIFSFGKNKRLVRNEEFRRVLARKLRASNELLVLYIAENDYSYPRLGVSVSSRFCAGAVVRNRLKRLIREAFRHCQNQIPAGFDYLVIISPGWLKTQKEIPGPKKAALKLSSEEVKASFLALVSQLCKKIR